MLRNLIWLGTGVMLSLSHPNSVYAQNRTEQGSTLSYGVEYLFPVEDSRNIETYNLDFFYPVADFKQINLRVSAVVSLTYATGDITQLEGEWSEGTLREVNYSNSAYGIGPGLLLDWSFPVSDKTSVHLEGIGNILLYSEAFPAGGEHHNFMWRGGPSIQYTLDESSGIGLGYHWAHISNGTGVGSQNPSYDAEGLFIRYSLRY